MFRLLCLLLLCCITCSMAQVSDELLQQGKELEKWPIASAKRVADTIAVKENIPFLLNLLKTGVPAAREASAYCLGKLKEPKAYPILFSFIKNSDMKTRLTTIFRSMVLINSKKAYQDITNFIKTNPYFGHDDAYNALLKATKPSHLPILQELFKSSSYKTRLLAVKLFSAIKKDEVIPYYLQALRDDSPYVSLQAIEYLASLSPDKTKEFLSWEKAKKEKLEHYALLILVLQEDRLHKVLIGYEWQSFIWQNIRSTNPLYRCIASVAIVNLGLRSEDPNMIEILDRHIPPTLIEILSGKVYFREYLSVQNIAYKKLVQLTGQNFGKDMSMWRDWWGREGNEFRSIRMLHDISQNDIESLRLDYQSSVGNEKVHYLFLVEAEQVKGDYDRVVYLNKKQAVELVNFLGKIQYFTLEQTYGKLSDNVFALELTLQKKVKKVTVYGTYAGVLQKLITLLEKYVQENSWQMYWDNYKRPNWDVWYIEESLWFSQNTDKKRRSNHLKKMIIESYSWISPKKRIIASGELIALMQADPELSPALVQWTITNMQTEMMLNKQAQNLIIALSFANNEMAQHAVIEFLLLNYTGMARKLLLMTLQNAKESMLLQYVQHANFRIRSVVAEVMGNREPNDLLIPWLIALLKDPHNEVLEYALISLGKWKLEIAWDSIYNIFQSPDKYSPVIREKALYSLTMIDPEKSKPLSSALLSSSDENLRCAAVQSLGMIADEIALRTIWQVLQGDASMLVRDVAKRVLTKDKDNQKVIDYLLSIAVSVGNTNIRLQALQLLQTMNFNVQKLESLLQDDEELIQIKVAQMLVYQYNATTIPILIHSLKNQDFVKESQKCLERITLTIYTENAIEQYQDWLKEHDNMSFPLILFEVLKNKGYNVVPMLDYILDEQYTTKLLPLGLSMLQDESWTVRAVACFMLEKITGKNFGEVSQYTTQKSLQEIIQSWTTYCKKMQD